MDPDAWRFEPSPRSPPTSGYASLEANPADRASPPTLKRTTVGAPAVADVQRLIAAAEISDPVLGSAIALGRVTGARRGELCALRWSDVDWPRRKLTIARSLTVIDKQATEGPTKTHQRRDTVMDAALETFLTRRRSDQGSYVLWDCVPSQKQGGSGLTAAFEASAPRKLSGTG